MEKKKSYLREKIEFFVPIFIIFYVIYCGFMLTKVYFAANELPERTGSELLRINIFGSSQIEGESTVSATFSLIDSNGNETAVIERSWAGNYLVVDFYRVAIAKKIFYFPEGIYAKNRIFDSARIKRGTKLSRYYDENTQCMLLGYGSTKSQRHHLYDISSFANGHYKVPRLTAVKKITIDLSDCKTGVYYSVQLGADGNLVLMEL